MKKAAATWTGEWWKLGGGGAVWDGIAYDPEADLIYVGTGNAGPWPEELARSRKARTTCTSAPSSRVQAGHRRVEVVFPDGARRLLGFRQRAAADAGRHHHQRAAAQGDHAGQQERLLLRDRPRHRPVHLRPAVREGHLGQRARSKHRTAHRESRSALRRRAHHDLSRRRAARTTGRPCRSTRPPAWCTFP